MGKEANILLIIILFDSVGRKYFDIYYIFWVVKEVLFLILVAEMGGKKLLFS